MSEGECVDDKPYHDREWLYERYVIQGKSGREIGREAGVGHQVIYKALRRLRIEVSNKEEFKLRTLEKRVSRRGFFQPRKHWNKAFLEREYIQNKRTISSIAAECGVSEHAVQRSMCRNGVLRRGKGDHFRGQRPIRWTKIDPEKYWDKEFLINQYINDKKSAGAIGKEAGVSSSAIIQWLDKHGIKRRGFKEAGKVSTWERHKGERNGRWKGGITTYRQRLCNTREWRAVVREVNKRDWYCRLCSSPESLEVHHISPFWESPLSFYDLDNLILLCKPCHGKMRCREHRWKKRLYALVKSSGHNRGLEIT